MKCPRCDTEGKVEVIATSPKGNVWEVYQCSLCYYSWRSTEDPKVSEIFKLTPESIKKLQVIPAVPPLDKE